MDSNARSTGIFYQATDSFQELIPHNDYREYLLIQNQGAEDLYLYMGPGTPNANDTLIIPAGETYEALKPSVYPHYIVCTTTCYFLIIEG